jgi:hypothetical protein
MLYHIFTPHPVDVTTCLHCGMIKDSRNHIPEPPPFESIKQQAMAVLNGKRDYMSHQEAAQHVLAMVAEVEEILSK